MLKATLVIIAIVLTSSTIFGQGIISGVVKDDSNGEPIPFAKVKVEGLNKGANTDFDGEYLMQLPVGDYTFIFSMSAEGFIDKKENITVIDGEEVILNVNLSKDESVQNLTAAVVKHVKTEGATSVEADDKRRRDAKGASDGMSKEQIKNSGASTAVEAAQMVPGLSIEDGKSVYVRGLGDRYTKTILNGMEIPGLDPDRNSVQMDIFPSTVIDNITVYKTFTPNFSGDFTGGLVDISTTDFPSKKTVYFKVGLGHNSEATFNKDYISYKGGKYDFLGFDDGTRVLPIRPTDKFPDPVLNDPKLTVLTSSFSDIMATEKSSNFLDQNYAFSIGNRINATRKSGKKFNYGYNVVLNYRNTHRFYDSVQFNEYRKDPDFSVNEIFKDRTSTGSLAENAIMWTGLIGQSIKFNRSKISLTLFHTQNGNSFIT